MTNSYSSSVKYADLTPKSLASAFIVPTGGFVRLPERSWDRDGADNLMLASWSAAMVSARGLGPALGWLRGINQPIEPRRKVGIVMMPLPVVAGPHPSAAILALWIVYQ
jgi:hypothetical protein